MSVDKVLVPLQAAVNDKADDADEEDHSDTFQWVIHQAKLKQIITSSQRTQFFSPPQCIGKVSFQILGIPQYDTNMFQLYLMLMDVSSEWHSVVVSAALSCKETLCGDANIFTFNAVSSFRAQSWCPSCLCIDDIVARKLSQLTLSVHVSILQIVSRHRRVEYPTCVSSSPRLQLSGAGDKLRWRVFRNDVVLAEMKRSLYGKSFISSIGHHFCVKLFPNGYQKIGAAHIEIQWLGTPHSLNGRLCKWRLSLAEADLCVHGEHRFSFDASSIHLKTNTLTFAKLRQFAALSFSAEFEVLREHQQPANGHNSSPPTPSPRGEQRMRPALNMTSPSPRSLASTEAMVQHNRQSVLAVSQYFTESLNKMYADFQCLRQAVHQQHQQYQQQTMQLNGGQQRRDAQLYELQQQVRALRASNAIASPRLLPPPQATGTEHSAVRHWLTTKVRLPQYFALFIEHGYDDMDVLLDVTDDDLVAMGVEKMGHRKKIIKYANLQNYPWVESGSAGHSPFSGSDPMMQFVAPTTNNLPYSPRQEQTSGGKQKTTPRSMHGGSSNGKSEPYNAVAAAAAASVELDFDIDVDVDFDGPLADIQDVINSVF